MSDEPNERSGPAGATSAGGPDAGVTTMMVIDHIKPDRITDYERWVEGIHGDLKRHPGFISVDTVRHLSLPVPEYIVLLKFDSPESHERWRNSPVLETWIRKRDELVVKSHYSEEMTGSELWFDHAEPTGHEGQSATPPLPAFWKRVVLSTACVYPMILLLIWAFSPVIGDWSQPAQIFVVVVVLSTLMTWPIMPYATRLLKPWLFGRNA